MLTFLTAAAAAGRSRRGLGANAALGEMNCAPTMLDRLEEHAARSPEKEAFVFLGNGTDETERLTYAGLRDRARGVAEVLRCSALQGRPVLLAYPAGLEFLVGLFGCFYAGAIAVPVPFPSAKRARERVEPIISDCRPGAVLTTVEIAEDQHWLPDRACPVRIATDAIGAAGSPAGGGFPDPAAIAFIQYSSGSTSAPKGVMISHANLAHNQRVCASMLRHDPEAVCVNWIPAYHDMGLIGALLHTLYAGCRGVLLPPLKVIQSPILWLRAISRYRGNSSFAPNFAYRLCLRAVNPEERRALDLSCWEAAVSGGEPVDAAVVEEFSAVFAEAGFPESAFIPGYGLAEATLTVTAPHRGDGPRMRVVDAVRLAEGKAEPPGAGGPRRLVACGMTHTGMRVVIVDPKSRRPLSPGCVGEIWVAGDSVAQGYWRNPTATREVFGACLAGETQGSYLRTGDLGFIGEEGLFITGRLKELLIIRGHNYYPHDLEDAVRRAHPLLETGVPAAFSITADGEEKLVVAIEPAFADAKRLDGDAMEAAVAAISRDFGLKLHDLVVLRPAAMPRTTSGKIRRGRCRELYLAGALPVLGGTSVPFGLGRRRAPAAEAGHRTASA